MTHLIIVDGKSLLLDAAQVFDHRSAVIGKLLLSQLEVAWHAFIDAALGLPVVLGNELGRLHAVHEFDRCEKLASRGRLEAVVLWRARGVNDHTLKILDLQVLAEEIFFGGGLICVLTFGCHVVYGNCALDHLLKLVVKGAVLDLVLLHLFVQAPKNIHATAKLIHDNRVNLSGTRRIRLGVLLMPRYSCVELGSERLVHGLRTGWDWRLFYGWLCGDPIWCGLRPSMLLLGIFQ